MKRTRSPGSPYGSQQNLTPWKVTSQVADLYRVHVPVDLDVPYRLEVPTYEPELPGPHRYASP